jgi:hypothetical protein
MNSVEHPGDVSWTTTRRNDDQEIAGLAQRAPPSREDRTMTEQAGTGTLSTGEMLKQLRTRFRITADYGDGQPLEFETGLFALETLIPGPDLLAKMTPGSSWSIVRLEDRVPPA